MTDRSADEPSDPPQGSARRPPVRRPPPEDALAPPAPTGRSIGELLHDARWGLAVFGVVALGRFVAVAGRRAYVYVDSAEYHTIDLSGRWRRPWATPLLFSLVGDDNRKEVWIQAAVGVVAWTVLALVVAAGFRDGRVRAVVVGAIVVLGLSTSVTNWDTAELSESLAISLTALVLAGWLAVARRPRPLPAALLVVVTVPWLFVRQSLLPTAWMVAGLAVVVAAVAWKRRGAWRVLAPVAVVLVAATVLASASYDRNQEIVQTNLTVIVANRIATDPGRLDWFLDHGMPEPEGGLYVPAAMEADPDFGRWVRNEGRATYTEFLVTHPWYAVTAPLPEMVGVRPSYADPPSPHVAMLSPADAYGSSRPVVPELLEQLVFEPGATGTVLSLLVLAIGGSVLRRHRADRSWLVPLAAIGVSLAALLVGWHGATPELNRLAIVAAVALRVGLFVLLGLLAEGELAARRRREVGRPGGAVAYPRPGWTTDR